MPPRFHMSLQSLPQVELCGNEDSCLGGVKAFAAH